MRTIATRMLGLALLTGLAASIAPGAVRAGGEGLGPSSIKWADGSRAPADAWTQEDGSPARTGATATPAMTGPRELGWRFGVAGEVEGEPLVWKNRTFVAERSGNKRTMHVLDSATGVERFKQTFDTPLPLSPCVYDGRVVLRSSAKTLVGCSLGDKALVVRWTVTAKSAMGQPTVFRDEVYVVVDGVLERRAYGSTARVWPKAGSTGPKVEGTSIQGVSTAPTKGAVPPTILEYPRPSLRENSIFLATGKRLLEFDRADGSTRREGPLPTTVDARLVKVVVGLADVMVLCGAQWKDGDGESDTVRFEQPDSGPFGAHPNLLLPFGITAVGREWVTVAGKGGSTPLALKIFSGGTTDTDERRKLATSTMHAELLETKVAPSSAGDVVFVGGRAFDADSLVLLRPEPLTAVSRTIPLRDGLLVVEAKNKVAYWRSVAKRPEVAPLKLLGTAGSPDKLPAAHAALEDGRVVAGAFSLDAKTGGLAWTGATPAASGTAPLASVRALVGDETPRRVWISPRPEDAAAGVSMIARAASVPDVLAVIPRALEVRDAALARKAQNAAAELGASAADLAKASKEVDALEEKDVERDFEKAADVEAALAAALAREPDLLVEVAGSFPASVPLAWPARLVRAAADRSRYHKGAAEWVRTHLPSGLSPKAIADVDEWVDFIEADAAAPVLVLGPGSKGPANLPTDVLDRLATARSQWREDLVGFLNGPLLVIAPPEHPSAIRRCLALGRIVCDRLDAEFASVGARRSDDEVLVLHLFPNKAEYLNQSVKEAGGEHGFGGLEHTAGHYSPSANVTRIFFATGQNDSVLGTYTHELTHHWIARRRPLRTPEETLGDRAGGPGYFIVEGFAEFVRCFAYDEAAGTADPANPRADGCDVVASCPAASLVPWSKLFAMPQREAYAGDRDKKVSFAMRWKLGDRNTYQAVLLYYAQACAATEYLWLADGGKYRPALIKHLYDHYAGESDPDALLKAVGCSADELGARIVAWCRQTVGATK